MQTHPKNIRITAEIDEKINEAVAKTGLTKAEVMRAAIELGIEDLLLVQKSPMDRLKDEVRDAKSKQAASVTGTARVNQRAG